MTKMIFIGDQKFLIRLKIFKFPNKTDRLNTLAMSEGGKTA